MTKEFNSNELNEILSFCIEHEITLRDYMIRKCKLYSPDFNKQLERCIKNDDMDTLKKYIAVDMIVRFNHAVQVWVHGTYYHKMCRQTQLALVNYFIEKGEYNLARKLTTSDVYPCFDKLDNMAIKYLFRDYGNGIILFTGYDSCIMSLSDEELKKVIDMHICGLKRLKALYEKLKNDGLLGLENMKCDEEGRLCDGAFIGLTCADGTTSKVIPETIYYPTKLIWICDEDQRNAIRELEHEIENLINYMRL